MTMLFFTVLPPMMFTSIYFIYKDSVRWRKYLWVYVLLIASAAYSYAPNLLSNTDLVRYIERLNYFSFMSLSGAIKRFYYLDIGEVLWSWIVAKLEIPELLATIPTLAVYGVASYITCDFAERSDNTGLIPKYLFLQFFLIPFPSVVNNVYCVFSFALVALAAYRDTVQHKRGPVTIVLYIISCVLQQVTIVILALRLLAKLFEKKKGITLIFVFLLPAIINFLYSRKGVFVGVPILYNVIERSGYYLFGSSDTEYARSVSTSLWYFVNMIINLSFAGTVLASVLLAQSRNTQKSRSDNERQFELEYRTFYSFVFLICVIAIACYAFSAPHYWRFNLIAQMCICPILISVSRNTKYYRLIYGIFSFVAMGQLLMQMYRLHSFVHIGEWVTNFLMASPFYIIFRIVVKALF